MAADGQCQDKSETLSQKWDKWASWENCDFFLGHVIKIWTVPGNPGRMVTLTGQ